MGNLAEKVDAENSIFLTVVWLTLLVLFAVVYIVAGVFIGLVKAASTLMVTG